MWTIRCSRERGNVRTWTPSLPQQHLDVRTALVATGAVAGTAFLSVGLAFSPFLTVGAVTGTLLMVFAMMQPLAVVGLMLVIGPADLSVLTGGFKSMFVQLGGLDMNGIRLLGMTAALTLVILAERGVSRQLLRPRSIFYALLVAYCVGTLAFSPDPLGGARLVLKIAYPLLVFVVVVGLEPSRERLDRLMDAVLIGAAVLCLVVNPLYVLFGDFERTIGGYVRLRGVGAHQNPFAFYLIAVILMAFVRFTTRRQVRYILLAAAASFWMVLTITRIAFAAAVVALLAVGIVNAFAARQTRVLIIAAVCAVLLAVPLGPPVIERTLGFMPTPGELGALLTNPRAMYNAINWEGRHVLWAIAFNAYMASPLLGLGMGASSFVLQLHLPMMSNPVVHNDYLRLLADAGVVGVVLFALALAAWAATTLKAVRLDDRTTREYALPAVGCIAALTIIGITDNAFDYYGPFTQYIGFLCGGAAASAALVWKAAQSRPEAEPAEPAPPRRFSWT
jgi:O-antigen ligase